MSDETSWVTRALLVNDVVAVAVESAGGSELAPAE